ncbi:MAG: PLDc N-terminal domain-containing protein [Verrucomicrobiales bacterium]|nr:PLDc N-terminal domain-containing protein [Verrucomicrobiales bacterium]
MIQVIARFLQLEVSTYHFVIPWSIGFLWLVLLGTTFSSLRSLDLEPRRKVFWGMVVLFLPLLGLAAYAFRCLICADWTFLKPLLQTRNKTIQSVTNSHKSKIE